MTLPPRLTEVTFPPEPDRADVIVARARRRRRSQAGGALGLAAASLVAVATIGGPGGTAGLREVDPAVTPSAGSATPQPPYGPGPSISYAPGAPGSPTVAPSASLAEPQSTTSPGTPIVRVTSTRTETISRETVPNRVNEPCADLQTTVYSARPGDSSNFCLRYSWPEEMTYGRGTTFVVEYCSLGRDVTAMWDSWPTLSVRSGGRQWGPGEAIKRQETLQRDTCWRWTIRWTGQSVDEPGGTARRLPRGTYDVRVDSPSPGETWVGKSNYGPNRQTTLEIV